MKKLAIILSLILVTTTSGFSPTILSFSTGQVSPLMEARTDFAKYRSSCRTLENFFVKVHGSAVRRPGTFYVANTKDNNVARLIPFEISTEAAFVLEFTNGFMRAFKDDGT